MELVSTKDIRTPVSNEHPATGNRQPATGIRHPATGIGHPASGIRHPAFGLLWIVLFFTMTAPVHAQQDAGAIDPHDSAFRAQFKDLKFDGALALKVASDQTNNYYILDFTQFSSRFEKVWFANRVFYEEKVVLADTDITRERVWFLSHNRYNEQDVLDLFAQMKRDCDAAAEKMTPEEQANWLATNDKYK